MAEKVTFFNKDTINCPACKHKVMVEVLRQGGGRLNAKGLQEDLKRTYFTSKKFGNVYPLIYNILVCQKCWFAALQSDYDSKNFNFSRIKSFERQRKSRGLALVKADKIDFSKPRDLRAGVLSYYLAVHCYNFYFKKELIDFYKGLFSLRGGWCARDLAREDQDVEMMSTAVYFRYLAAIYYENFVSLSEQRTISDDIHFYGPDIDHNFGFKGAVYLSALLSDEFIELGGDQNERLNFYTKLLRRLSRVFGVGRQHKGAPSQFLEMVHDLHSKLKSHEQEFIQLNGLEPVAEVES